MTRSLRTPLLLGLIALGMLSLGFYSKTLYDTFCRITGFGGTPQISENGENTSTVIDREVTVRFDSNVSPDLPWTFKPEQGGVTLKMGETGLAYYKVKNNSTRPLTGVATFNVTPMKAAPYFVKTECFCFTDQTLQPGQEMSMPVLFFVDSRLDESARHDDVQEIYLSYTFFESDTPAAAQAEAAAPGGAAGRETLN